MVLGIYGVKFTQSERLGGGNSFATAPVNTNKANMWDVYKADGAKDVENLSTVDAMAKLNAINNPKDVKEAQKKAKAMEKMAKLSKTMQDKNFLNLTQKHMDAFKLLDVNPALSGLTGELYEKLIGITSQNVYLIQKLELSSMQDLSADEINKICNDISKAAKELEKDAKKIRAGILKAGAYSEAMMKIDDPEKKAKYEKLANETVKSLPDAFKNKAEAAEVQDRLEELNGGEDVEEQAEDEISENNDLPESDELGEVGDFQSPFLYDDDGTLLIEKFEAENTAEDNAGEISETSGDENSNIDDNSDNELKKIRDEYKKDLKEQKEKTGKDPEPIKDDQGRIVKSLLDVE